MHSTELKLETEYTRLLYSFLEKAYLGMIPFGLALGYLFFEHVTVEFLSIWIALVSTVTVSQYVLIKRYRRSSVATVGDKKKWTFYATISVFITSCVIALLTAYAAYLPQTELFIINNTLMASITLFVASGFRKPLIAYAIPILVSFAVAGFSNFGKFWYLGCGMLMIVLAMLIVMSRYFENTLRNSIRIRFENSELIDQLKQSKTEAVQANQAKSKLLAAASHDLRQPLYALGLYLEALNNTLDTGEQTTLSGKARKSLDALNVLFDNLLDISKLDSGIIRASLANFELRTVLDGIRENYLSLAREKQLSLKIESTNTIVNSDRALLGQLIGNLIGNAIRYTDIGCISLTVRESEKHAVVTISDTGIGIPESELENIFDEFYQLNNPERNRTKGMGLGLSIVRRLVDLLGYEFNLKSREGVGTTAKIKIPKGDSNQIDKPQPTALTMSIDGLKVLAIDDDEAIQDSYKLLLTRWGCDVIVAGNLENALNHLDLGFQPNILIADNRLEDSTDELDVIASINRHLGKSVPAILITGDTSEITNKKAADGNYHLLHKPVTPILLKKTIALVSDKITGKERNSDVQV